MNELEKVYRDAPQFESPAGLDQKVLRAARSRAGLQASKDMQQPETGRLNSGWGSGWRKAAYALPVLCMFGIGLGVLLETGMLDNPNNNDPFSSSSTDAGTEVAAIAPAATGALETGIDGVAQTMSRTQQAVPCLLYTSPSPRDRG